MDFLIRLENGQPVDNPISLENFVIAFPNIDPTIHEGFAVFERVSKPQLGPYETGFTHSYGWVDGVVKDIWAPVEMSFAEKAIKISHVQQLRPFESWVFDEAICDWVPPVPIPENGKHLWDESSTSWVEVK